MPDLSNTLVVIPARSGSKGIPNKNIKKFNGEPLLLRTVNQALRIFEREQIFVSTDSQKYIELVERETTIKIPSLRPKEISNDNSTNIEYIRHALSLFDKEYEWVLVLQCTSPLRLDSDIKRAFADSDKLGKYDMLTSVNIAHSNPYYVHRKFNEDYTLSPLFCGERYINRQQCPVVHELNGLFFLINVESIRSKPEENWIIKAIETDKRTSLDIDDDFDFELAELIERRLVNEIEA